MFGVCCDVDIFKLTESAQSINREVYAESLFLRLPTAGKPADVFHFYLSVIWLRED